MGKAVGEEPNRTVVGTGEKETEVGRTMALLLWVWNKRGPPKGAIP